jgi:1,2-phenylacetyl-CoA epoxidase PaaB subunit
VLGYETYVRMAGPFRDDQVLHCTDNREEMQRARHAFELAAKGVRWWWCRRATRACSPWLLRCSKRCTSPATRPGTAST